MGRTAAADVVAALVDDPVDLAVDLAGRAETPDPIGWPDYPARVAAVREEVHADEAVRIVRGRVAGTDLRAVFAVWDFAFLGGTMGTVVGRRLVAAYDHAREAGLPVVLLPSTGGARMQEGMASLVQMPATLVAARRHAEEGLIQVAYLRDPTTGGVFASQTNHADVLYAEPEATIGFAGPRVAEALTDGPLPDASHSAEGARAAGLVDDVVPLDELAGRLGQLLSWPGRYDPQPLSMPEGGRRPPGDAWQQVERARASDRARTPSFLETLDVRAELRGDRAGGDDPTIRVVLARLGGRSLVFVAMDRTVDEGRVTPAGYRKAWRGLALAERIRVPLVTLVDTPGADASASSEAGGIAHHISATFSRLLALNTTTVALVIGEGGSGGALALSVADRLLIQEHAIFSVIAPEGAAAILHRDRSRAPDVAGRLRLTATDLLDLGIADGIVDEPAGLEVEAALAALAENLDEMDTTDDPGAWQAGRYARWGDPLRRTDRTGGSPA